MTLFFAMLLFLLVCRDQSIGMDLPNYEYMFRKFAQLSFREIFAVSTEAGYVLLNKAVALLTDNFQWQIALAAVLAVWPVAVLYRRETENAYLTIALFLCMSNFILLFSGLRQSIAIAIGTMAYGCVKRRQPVRFLLLVALAFLFHETALVLLLLYPAYYVRLTKKSMFWLIPALTGFLVFNRQIFAFLLSLLPQSYNKELSFTGAYAMLALFAVLTVLCFVLPDPKRMDEQSRGLRHIMLLCAALQTFALWHPLAMRMNYYFMIFIPVLIPKMIARSAARWRQLARLVKNVLIVGLLCYFFFGIAADNSLQTFPYRFFWQTDVTTVEPSPSTTQPVPTEQPTATEGST